MHTLTLETKDYGTVRVHHNSDWSGLATLTYQADGELKEAQLPGYVFLWVGQEAAKHHIRRLIDRALDTDITSATLPRGPSFNHTRADGAFDPCPLCLDQMQAPELRKLVKSLQGEIADLRKEREG